MFAMRSALLLWCCCAASLAAAVEPVAALALAKNSSKGKHKTCEWTGLPGDYRYAACGTFCKEAKAENHCRYCKCRTCNFCASKPWVQLAAELKPAGKKGGGGKAGGKSLKKKLSNIKQKVNKVMTKVKDKKEQHKAKKALKSQQPTAA